MKKFAAFDIDGTIFRWQLYHELFDALNDEGLIPVSKVAPVLDARERWRERQISYDQYETVLVRAMRQAVVGLQEVRFNEIADKILEAKGHHTYRYTLKLLKDLKKEGYVIIAISGSYQQLVERFATLHGIDIAVGRNHVIENGKLTAESTEIFGRKDAILKELMKTHDLTTEGSYAIGDSGGDITMLELVTNPLAFNPDERLYHKATQMGWPIVIERKNLAYHLRKGSDGTYLLAQTDRF
jgi:HAD superfamily hydrolase (TIGR01490 family)